METVWNIGATGLFLFAAVYLVLRWLGMSGASLPGPFSDPLPEREETFVTHDTLFKVFFAAIIFRVAVALGSFLLYGILSGDTIDVWDLPSLWVRWDGTHYVKLVELGYGGYVENGQNLFLVFFPLYVWIVRAVRLLIPNTALAGMLVSFLCFGGGSVYLYALTAGEYGERKARRTLALLWAFPFSFFFGGIMTESLFFLTTTAGLYHIRKHQWWRVSLWGIAAALTRMQGVILIGAAVAELVNWKQPFCKRGTERRKALTEILKRLPLLCTPVLGSLGYLVLNYYVTGDPLAFLTMQKHWSQGFMWFPKVLTYLWRNALNWYNPVVRWELWVPEVILFPLFAWLLWKSRKKHRSMFVLYAFVYFTLNYCLSWLLSAGRYLSCGVPFFLFGAEELEGHPKWTAALIVIMGFLQCVLLYRYFCWGQVM